MKSIAEEAGKYEAHTLYELNAYDITVFYAMNHFSEALRGYDPLDDDEAIDYVLGYVREVARIRNKAILIEEIAKAHARGE